MRVWVLCYAIMQGSYNMEGPYTEDECQMRVDAWIVQYGLKRGQSALCMELDPAYLPEWRRQQMKDLAALERAAND